MSSEYVQSSPEDFEILMSRKEKRLPKGVSTFIRRLKKEGDMDKANIVRQETLKQKFTTRAEAIAQEELDKSVEIILSDTDPLTQAVESMKLLYYREIAHQIDVLERRADIKDLYEKNHDIATEIEDRWSQVREPIERLIKSY